MEWVYPLLFLTWRWPAQVTVEDQSTGVLSAYDVGVDLLRAPGGSLVS